ncbi:MAG: hypothetical protein M9909_02990 [Thermomicrobiales bacterium]|nr:hypothetical protein [Thermomicrobiales bacterium]
MHIGIVFNPGSGVRAARGALGEVTSAIASHNHTLEVFDRAVQPDFERAISAHAHEFDRVVVIGGDGTLNGVVNGVMASEHPEIPVAFVPTGRGKDGQITAFVETATVNRRRVRSGSTDRHRSDSGRTRFRQTSLLHERRQYRISGSRRRAGEWLAEMVGNRFLHRRCGAGNCAATSIHA